MSLHQNDPEDLTLIISAAAGGDRDAASRLMPLVYEQLRNAAQRHMSQERAGHTLSATVLVHEAYLKLAGPRDVPWVGRGHFYAAAAEAMQRILIDYARAKASLKRGGPEARRAALNLASLPDLDSEADSSGFLVLHDAIARLEKVDRTAAQIVRLRYFAGLSIDQTALALGISSSAVKQNWSFARGWLKHSIESADT